MTTPTRRLPHTGHPTTAADLRDLAEQRAASLAGAK